MRKQVELLKNQSEIALDLGQFSVMDIRCDAVCVRGNGTSPHIGDITRVNSLKEGGTAKERTLSGAAGSDDTDDFAGIDMHADILKNLQITERFLDSVHL